MRIAIVGGGFAGCALSFYLQSSGKAQVTLFDKKGIGSGASGIAAGLLHPYVGEQVRRSALADEGMEATRYLLETAARNSEEPIADYSGIIRVAQSLAQQRQLVEHTQNFSDITQIDENQFLIHSGITVQTNAYLNALWSVCEKWGATFEQREIHSLSEIEGYDAVVAAAGSGIFDFKEFEGFRLNPVRGQIIVSKKAEGALLPERSMVGKGYIAKGVKEEEISLGATYERGVRSDTPDLESALKELQPKIEALWPSLKIDLIEVKAGVRISSVGHYFPVIGQVKDSLWVMTGLGSRGLLYHALFAKMLSQALLEGDDSHFPSITKVLLSKNKSMS